MKQIILGVLVAASLFCTAEWECIYYFNGEPEINHCNAPGRYADLTVKGEAGQFEEYAVYLDWHLAGSGENVHREKEYISSSIWIPGMTGGSHNGTGTARKGRYLKLNIYMDTDPMTGENVYCDNIQLQVIDEPCGDRHE